MCMLGHGSYQLGAVACWEAALHPQSITCVWEHTGIVWSLLAPAMLGWDCVYSTGAIIAEGNQEGRADGANASYMAEIKAQANVPSEPVTLTREYLKSLFLHSLRHFHNVSLFL